MTKEELFSQMSSLLSSFKEDNGNIEVGCYVTYLDITNEWDGEKFSPWQPHWTIVKFDRRTTPLLEAYGKKQRAQKI